MLYKVNYTDTNDEPQELMIVAHRWEIVEGDLMLWNDILNEWDVLLYEALLSPKKGGTYVYIWEVVDEVETLIFNKKVKN